jgi:hypothetical protein
VPDLSRAFLASLDPSGEGGDGVIALAITVDQCRDRDERERLIRRAISGVSRDRVLWVEVPGQWRSTVMRALRERGLAIGTLAVRRGHGISETYIAFSARAVRFAIERGHLSRRWLPALAMLRLPLGRALLTRALRGIGFAAFRPGTRPFAWLAAQVDGQENAGFILKTNWRGERAPYLVFGLGSDQTLVAKRGGAGCQDQIEHEAAMLKALAPGVQRCGLAVPRLFDSYTENGLSTLIESDVPGRPMASLIRDGRHRDLGKIADRLAEWLACWNKHTLRHVELTGQLAEQLILSAARPLAGSIDRGSGYLEWLSAETRRLVGSKVPIVAAHNDLTMANVLGDAAGIRSIVDWEAASIEGLPLTDFRYAVCDAAAAIGKCDRVTAFRECFLKGGAHRAHVEQSEAALREIVGGPPGWLELCAHAGWLRHAANEQARSSSSRFDASFLAIANPLADSAVAH